MDSRQLLVEALRLSDEERAALAGELIQSLETDVDPDGRPRGPPRSGPALTESTPVAPGPSLGRRRGAEFTRRWTWPPSLSISKKLSKRPEADQKNSRALRPCGSQSRPRLRAP